jgi:hypothetical protein
MNQISETYKRLIVYEERLYALRCACSASTPCGDLIVIQSMIDFYESEIDLMKAELAVEDLKVEMDLNSDKPNVVWTDRNETVAMLLREERVTKLEIRWSWRRFKHMFYIEFYYKKRF